MSIARQVLPHSIYPDAHCCILCPKRSRQILGARQLKELVKEQMWMFQVQCQVELWLQKRSPVWSQILPCPCLRLKRIHPEIAPGFVAAKPCRAPTQTQSLESWELHLLRVSSELKMKLKDPHFVAKRCDLDSSGDLDMHELKQATRAFGMKFSSEELQAFMAGEARITKERFAHIVKDALVTSAERSQADHSPLLAWHGTGTVAAVRVNFHHFWVVVCQMQCFQLGTCRCHSWREEVPTSCQPLCYGHLCGDPNVTTGQVWCQRSRQCKHGAWSQWNDVIFRSGQPVWSHCPLFCVPFLGSSLQSDRHSTATMGRDELWTDWCGEPQIHGVLDLSFCFESTYRSRWSWREPDARTFQCSLGTGRKWCSHGPWWRDQSLQADLVFVWNLPSQGAQSALGADLWEWVRFQNLRA